VLKDRADVIELVRTLSLPRDLAGRLDASVRGTHEEFRDAAQASERGQGR